MASENKSVLNSNFEDKRTFKYSKGNCNLDFTLRTDIITELVDFRELLIKAAADLELQIQATRKQ